MVSSTILSQTFLDYLSFTAKACEISNLYQVYGIIDLDVYIIRFQYKNNLYVPTLQNVKCVMGIICYVKPQLDQ